MVMLPAFVEPEFSVPCSGTCHRAVLSRLNPFPPSRTVSLRQYNNILLVGARGFSLLRKCVEAAPGGPTQPPIQWVLGSLLEVKRPGHEVYHSPLSSAEVKNE